MAQASDHLRSIHNFQELVRYLEDQLGWPLQEYGFDDLTFEYDPAELGLKDEDAAKVKAIHQLRPLQQGQPWGIFFVEFEKKKLPVVVLRRILSHLVVKKRASANRSNEAAWHADDLLFVTAFGEEDSNQREIAFAHFHQSPGDLPTLRVLGWDGGDTPLKLSHLDAVLRQRLCWPDDPGNHKAWRDQWRAPFKHRLGHVIRTADTLAEALAALARGINAKAKRMLAAESANGPLRQLHKAFQAALIHDLTEESFSDTYAQTITYGLLTAAISRTEGGEGRHGTFIVAENVTDMVPITNPFLKEMLQTFLKVGGRKGGIDFDELGIQDVVDLLRGDETDLPAILRDFGNKTQGEDPVIHFYEHFLAAYNKKLKVQRGVFYTPKPVVSYIVRSVHELLQTEFGLEDGLASTVTWGEMAKKFPELKFPAGVSPDFPFVMVLDPATGTATFLVEVINVIHKTMTAKWQKEGKQEVEIGTLWNEYVPKHLLPRLYGYELMMAPYAIAHMKIGLKLFETGYHFMSDERVRVYLTNALEPASDEQKRLVGIIPALAHEAEAVNTVKRNIRFTVVVGNPPYARISSNMGQWICDLIEDFKYIDGIHFAEVKHWLHDDYVKFIRLAYFILNNSGCGIFGMITNRGFLSGPTFRGMRCFLLKESRDIHILDLHGGAIQEECEPPPGSEDKNVFDIKQGVTISLSLIGMKKDISKTQYYSELWGNQQIKYDYLTQSTVSNSRDKIKLAAISPRYSLVPNVNVSLDREYSNFIAVNNFFSVGSTGIQTSRDGYVVAFEKSVLENRFDEFCNTSINDDYFRVSYGLEDGRNWNLKDARIKLLAITNRNQFIVKCQFRPLDIRWMLYHSSVINWPRPEVMPHMLQPNLALIVPRNYQGGHYDAALVSRLITEVKTGESTRGSYCYPIYIYKNSASGQLTFNNDVSANFNRAVLNKLLHVINLKFIETGLGDLKSNVGPEGIVNYFYACLYSPSYRNRYSVFTKNDFPRVPLTSNLELFRSLTALGGELCALHLLESPKVNDFITTFTGKGDNSIPKKPTWKDNAVWINPTQRFDGVPENVWNFHIGGYQVCEKWLKDRKGRTLSDDDITHYQRIVVALNETIRIMAGIDRVIDEHGGWPIK